jgi:hypothetical protein
VNRIRAKVADGKPSSSTRPKKFQRSVLSSPELSQKEHNVGKRDERFATPTEDGREDEDSDGVSYDVDMDGSDSESEYRMGERQNRFTEGDIRALARYIAKHGSWQWKNTGWTERWSSIVNKVRHRAGPLTLHQQ